MYGQLLANKIHDCICWKCVYVATYTLAHGYVYSYIAMEGWRRGEGGGGGGGGANFAMPPSLLLLFL